MHLTLGILRKSQAVFYALSFFWLDGFAVPAPAQVTQTVGQPRAKYSGFWFIVKFQKNIMPDKKVKFTRWSLGLVFILSIVLHNIWQGGKNLWAYWVSWFLSGGEFTIFGLAFLFFPYFMLKVCGIYKEDLDDIPKWKIGIIGLIAGIPSLILGINLLAPAIRRYLLECHFHICLPSVP